MTVLPRIYNRVLVLLDGSSTAEFALRFAVDLASKHETDLFLLYLDDLLAHPDNDTTTDAQAAEKIEQYLDGLCQELQNTGVRIQTHWIPSRNLSETLFKTIEAESISVLVMSIQGRTGMLRWLFGRRVEQGLHEMPVPLLLVRPVYQKIVVPLDGTKWSESAVPRASELARVHDAELVLLHVYHSKSNDYAGQWALAGQQQIADQSYEQVHEQLVSLRNRLRQEGINARDMLIRGNNPAQAILEFVDSEDGISLIVMSTHGRKRLSRWLLGSVAQTLVREARCPVRLIKPDAGGQGS